MRIKVALIFSVVFTVGMVILFFTFYQISSEKAKLRAELEKHTAEVATFFISQYQTIKPGNLSGKDDLTHLIDSFCKTYHVKGIAVYVNPDSITANREGASLVPLSVDYIQQAMSAGTSQGTYLLVNGEPVFQYIRPLSHTDLSSKAVIIYTEAQYIENILQGIWKRNFLRWFVQALIISLITFLVIEWEVLNPLNKILSHIREARRGNTEALKKYTPRRFLVPLHKEVVHVVEMMNEAKAIAEEEARLRARSEAVWTPERLKVEVKNLLQNARLIVVSNREPYMHIREGKNIRCIVPASGMITAMEPILKVCGGLWIASATGDADRETADQNGKIQVPPDDPRYTLKRLWLTEEEEKHFYYGFSNEGIWPLCHIAHTRPVFRKEDWQYYKKVNEKFARTVLEETAGEEQPYILIQDYHFSLLPRLIRKEKPAARIALFWHIPWPNPESFSICPWQKEILEGMLGADLIGFHTQYHCNHFLETVNNALESIVLWENFLVKVKEQRTFVKPFPISIPFTLKDYDQQETENSLSPSPSQILARYGIVAEYMGIGVERIDYTKGLIEKMLAIEYFLEKNPSYMGKFTFVQIGAPSRMLLSSYAGIFSRLVNEVERINNRFKTKNWKPVLLLPRHHSQQEIEPFYEAAHFCLITSLHDGMNLVAKEFVARRHKNNGVLILSRFAGASQELTGALVINPYNIEETAKAIKNALEMPLQEQYQRMKRMRQMILANNIYAWAARLITNIASLSFPHFTGDEK